jgi:hypothetical protein
LSRLSTLLLVGVLTALAASTVVLAQAQPLIVFIARSVLGGFLSGPAHRAGEEFYEQVRRPNGPESAPRPAPPYPPPDAQRRPSPPATIAVPPPVPSGGLRWAFRNLHSNDLGMQFYTQIPNGKRIWPAGGRAYLFHPGDHYVLQLRCVPGERVCFGAWSAGKYWGTGYGCSMRARTVAGCAELTEVV